ncbi:MAG: alpha-2-macroglobulin family protein [Leptospirales bacterium]|nr:alpha-2-macroglobulin family protein [Leptospirales bacterium]
MFRRYPQALIHWLLLQLDRYADWLPESGNRLLRAWRELRSSLADRKATLQRQLSARIFSWRARIVRRFEPLRQRKAHMAAAARALLGQRVRAPLQRWRERSPRAYARAFALGVTTGALVVSGGLCSVFFPRAPGVGVQLTPPAPYIAGENRGPSPVILEFGQSVAPLERIGRAVDQGVELSPTHPGRWEWTNDRRLSFWPSADWSPGRRYQVRMAPVLHAEQISLNDYSLSFQIPPLHVTIKRLEFYVDYTNPNIKQIVGTIYFNYPIDVSTVKQRLRLVQKSILPGTAGREFSFTLNFNESRTEAYLQSENIEPPEERFQVELQIAEGMLSTLGGEPTEDDARQALSVPARDELFRIEDASVQEISGEDQQLERVLAISTLTEARDSDVQGGLEAYLLPRDRAASPGTEAELRHEWQPEEIDPALLRQSQRIELTAAAGEREFAREHTYRFAAEGGRWLYVRIKRGARNFAGYTLREDFVRILRVAPFPRRIAVQQQGALLSLMGEKKISVAASGVRAVKIEIDRVLPDQINHLVSQTRGDFQNPYFNSYSFNETNLAEHFEEIVRLAPPSGGEVQYFAFDFSRYLTQRTDKTGLFFLRLSEYVPPDPAASQSDDRSSGDDWDEAEEDEDERPLVVERRFVLVSDLGMLVKEAASGERDLFVQSVSRGTPEGDVQVEVLGRNGLPVASAKTDATGRVSIPSLRDLQREKEPTAFLLRKGTDVSFMPYARGDRQLNLSRFDIGGVVGADRPETLTAFLFTDRGLYRPGEEAHIGLIVKSGDWNRRLEGAPLELSIVDARGAEVQRTPLRLNRQAFHELKFESDPGSPTGVYQVNLYTMRDQRRASLLGAASFRIEEFQPDRMQIRASFSAQSEEGWVSPRNLHGVAELRHLFGQAASGNEISGEMELAPAAFAFARYPGYNFHDPARADRRIQESLEAVAADEKGRADFNFHLERFGASTYRLTFVAEGYESGGGRSVTAIRSILVSPLERVIGYRADGSLDYIARGATRGVDLIAVGPDAQRTSSGPLTARTVEVRYVSVLARAEDGVYRYTSVRREIPLREEKINIGAAGLRLNLPSSAPGDFVIYIEDANHLELNHIAFSIAGAGTMAGRLDRGAELQLRLEKGDYAPGEEIRLNIVAPYVGAGLITIERDRVYAHKWFQTSTNSTVQSIVVPASLEGSAYVNVAFIRSPASPEVYSAPLSYAVQPFSISRARRANRIQLQTPDKALPGRNFPITYSTSQPGRIAVFAVDEGILQVARYQTPDPLAHFFRKRALETRTTQILDLILPEYSMLRRSRPGGGDDGDLGRNLNPFRRRNLAPAVYWSGIVQSDATPRTLQYRVPEYFNGTLRVMAVAVSDAAIGATERRSIIQDHFVITPSAPLFLAPGDVAEVSVGVANNVEGSGENAQLTVRAESSGPLSIPGNAEQKLTVAEGKERIAVFRVQARDEPGPAELHFRVEGAGKSSQLSATLSVRPATIYRTSVTGGFAGPGVVEAPTPRRTYDQFRRHSLSLSRLPLGLARGLQEYLRNYPYGCTEQLVSQATPHMLLANRAEFVQNPEQSNAAFTGILRVLRARQNSEGGFGFWSANSFVSPFQSAYVVQFLTEAKERGRPLPPELLERSLKYLEQMSVNDSVDLRSRAFALYLRARNGQVVSNEVLALRRKLAAEPRYEGWQQDSIALYLAAAHKLMRQEPQAAELITRFNPLSATSPDYAHFYDGLLRDATFLYIVAKHFPDQLSRANADLLQRTLRPVYANSFNSLSAAMTIFALDALAAQASQQPLDVQALQILENGTQSELSIPRGLFPQLDFAPQTRVLRLANRSALPLFYQAVQSGFDRRLPAEASKESLEIFRELQNLEGQATDHAAAGEDLQVVLRIRGIGSTQSNVAVVDLIPGGFEAQIDSARAEFSWRPENVDVREDRIILYGSADDRLREFRYRIRATNPGEYVIPPAYAEGMYDRAVRAVMPSPGRLRVAARP